MYKVTEGSQAALDAELGYPFGYVKRVPGIPIHTGARAIVREKLLAATTSGLLKIDDVVSLDRFPDSGQLTIENERLSYASKDRDAIGFNIASRGDDTTTAADHDVGEPISEYLPEQIFVFYEDPGGFEAESIDTVYVNGVLKDPDVVPTHVADPADSAAGHDVDTDEPVVLGSIRVDMTATILGPFITVQTVTQVQAVEQVQQMAVPTSSVDSTSGGSGRHVSDYNGTGGAPSAAQIAPDPSPPTSHQVRGPKLLPQIGTVTADVTGIVDDDAGTISGTPGLLLRNPAYCAKFILKIAFQQTSFDDVSFTAAAAACEERGYVWDFLFTRMSLGDFQALVFRQSQVHVFSELGVWKAKFRERGTPQLTLRQARRVSWDMDWTPIAAVLTEIAVSYGQGEASKTLVVTSPRGQALVGQRPGTVELPWIGDEAIARSLGNNHLRLNDHQRREGVAVMHSEVIGIEKQDTVAVEADMLEPYGGTALFWRARGAQMQPDRTVRVLLEEDDAAQIFAAPGAILITGTDATLIAGARLTASPGSVVITGTAATLAPSARLAASPGSIVITGAAATLVGPFRLTADPGSIVITGMDATLSSGAGGLLEDGTTLLLEDGTALLLEA